MVVTAMPSRDCCTNGVIHTRLLSSGEPRSGSDAATNARKAQLLGLEGRPILTS